MDWSVDMATVSVSCLDSELLQQASPGSDASSKEDEPADSDMAFTCADIARDLPQASGLSAEGSHKSSGFAAPFNLSLALGMWQSLQFLSR